MSEQQHQCPGCNGEGSHRVSEWRCCGQFSQHPVPECCENAVRWPIDYPCQYCGGTGTLTHEAYLELVGPER